MRKFLGAVLAAALVCGIGLSARAGVDKAIKALGGADKLSKIKALTWTNKGKITLKDTENDFTSKVTIMGLDHFRQDMDGEFGGNKVKILTILGGNKGWRSFGGNNMEMDEGGLVN